MSEAMKPTPGPWTFYTEPQPNGCPIVGNGQGLMVAMVAHSVNHSSQKDVALSDARLIAEAGTVFHETGLSPRQLAERIWKLEEHLKLIVNTDPIDAALDPQRAVRVARAALAQSEGSKQ